MATILVIEDELKIVHIIKAYLEREGFKVIAATDGAAGLNAIETCHPDLLILDLMLPLISGETILTKLRQTSEIPVLILSAKCSEEERIFGLNIGADDYLVKPFSPRELVARVQAHLRRSKATNVQTNTARTYNHCRLVIDEIKHEIRIDDKPVNLTPTEFKIINILSQTQGQVFSRSQLVEQVQGNSFEGYDRTIDSHIKNLRQKIESNPNEPTFILTVFGIGYKFGGVPD